MTLKLDDLLTYLHSEHLQERQQAAIELSRIKDVRLIQPLLAALDDADSTVRANAAAGLGHNAASDAVEALIALLKDVRNRATVQAS